MQKIYLLATISFLFVSITSNGQVGIGTPTPNASAMLHVNTASTGKGLLVTGIYDPASTVADLGASSRLIFYPGKAAFRAGYVEGIQWDNINVGLSSVALGHNTIANGSYTTALGSGTQSFGSYSIAMGSQTLAGGMYSTSMGSQTYAGANYSTAMGNQTKAFGTNSTATGNLTQANGFSSIAMGNGTIASGSSSTAMGNGTIASGFSSTAMGVSTNAIGDFSTAIGNTTNASGRISLATGNETIASGDNSTAMGIKVNTNFKGGAFIIGDSDPNREGETRSGITDQLVARFWNGYYFLTSGDANRFGVQIGHHGNFWTAICDKNRKENFETLDGEDVLQKISKMNFTSWNYKKQDPKAHRHYGIMAQDFHNAFGHDKYGSIGNDSTVNPIDMIGIDMAAIQALEKRTTDLKNENESLKESLTQLQLQFKEQQKVIAQSVDQLKALAKKQSAMENIAVK